MDFLLATSYRYSSSSSDSTTSAVVGMLVVYIVVVIGIAIVFGLITKHMNENKGYTGGFAWGFFLGLIGIIVVACKTDLRTYPQNNTPAYSQNNAPSYAPPRTNLQQPANDVADRIKKLADLHAQGILSDEEFETKKAELLSKM